MQSISPDTTSRAIPSLLRKRAFLLGIDISGTGVRNDFTYPDAKRRQEDLTMVKNWIEVAAKLGAPVSGLILDTGSFRAADPYAVNWQIKENVFVKDRQVGMDVPKLVKIIRASGYRGYLPIETLGAGDPKVKVTAFLAEVRKE